MTSTLIVSFLAAIPYDRLGRSLPERASRPFAARRAGAALTGHSLAHIPYLRSTADRRAPRVRMRGALRTEGRARGAGTVGHPNRDDSMIQFGYGAGGNVAL
jgi:hypothetical protein